MSAGRRFGAGVVVMLLVGAMAAPAAAAADGAHVWTRQFGTYHDETVSGVAAHSTGVYLGGYTEGNLKGTKNGGWDGFVSKYNHNGKLLWTRQFGTAEHDQVFGVAAHSTGVYLAGDTGGNLGGTQKGWGDGFVRKYDHNGKRLWTRQFGTPAQDFVYGVAVDATGVYLAGSTGGNLSGTNKGNLDGFVRKYDHNGKLLWSRQFGTDGWDQVSGVAVNATGVYLAGSTGGNLWGTKKGFWDGYVRKYDHNGKHLWTRQFGTMEGVFAHGVAVDATGVYLAGHVRFGSLQGTAKGGYDAYVRKYNHSGRHLWTRQFGTTEGDEADGVAVDATGVYVGGYTEGNLSGTNKGGKDGFVRKYNHNGMHQWTRQFGTLHWDRVFGVAVHSTGVYLGGYTAGSLQGTNQGFTDGYVRKYGTG